MFQKSKKALSLAVVIAIVMSMFALASFSVSAEESTNGTALLGDANLDGSVKIDDVTLIQKYIAEYAEVVADYSDTQKLVSDVNGDGDIDIKDVTVVQKWLADIPVDEKVGEPVVSTPDEATPGEATPGEATPGESTPEEPTTEPATTEPVTTEPEETTEPQPQTKTIYFDNSVTQWDVVALYQWTDGTTSIKLEPVEGTDNIFSAVVSVNVTKGLFKNIDSTSDWDMQTADVDVPGDGMIFVPNSADNKTTGSWTEYSTEPTTTEPQETTEPTTEATPDEPTTTEPATTEPATTEPTTDATDDEATTDEAAANYYLAGYINKTDVGVNNNSANADTLNKDLVFVDGALTVELSDTSYVCIVKEEAGTYTYFWTEGWLGMGNTTATLTSTPNESNKLAVDAGTVTFTVVDNADGTVTVTVA